MSEERRLLPIGNIPEERHSWVWQDRLPAGAITTLDGDPGVAKSTIAYDLAARITSGRAMPGCNNQTAPAGVVVLGAEDAIGATIRPRLQAAGADLGRIYVYDRRRFQDRPLLLPDDIGLVETAAGEVAAKLVVIDPLTAFLARPSGSEQGVRAALAPLVAMAERMGLAVLVLRHLAKGSGGNPLYRGLGSIGVVALARSALLVTPDPAATDPFQHVLVQTKTNLSSAVSLSYRTVMRAGIVAIEWLGVSPCQPRDLTGGRAEHTATLEGAYVLYSVLADGPVWATEAYAIAGRAGVTRRTVERAKVLLGVRSRKVGSGRGSRWYWQLPADERFLRPFKDRDLDELMDHLLHGTESPPEDIGPRGRRDSLPREPTDDRGEGGEPLTPP